MKLIRILISNDRKILFFSALSVIIGFTFIFTITTLSDTVIKTNQENTVKTYGKFLMVIPEISEEDEENIKRQCSQFSYEHFGIVGNMEYEDKMIAVGTMQEYMGENLGFTLINGKWPQFSNQVAVEEWLLHLFGMGNETLPCYVSLKKDGESVQYEITGVISNYSYLLSTSYGKYLETKAYPSVICGGEQTGDVKQSLVIMQKQLDFKNAEDDMGLLPSDIATDTICMNERLYGNGYKDNEDMIYTGVLYLVLLNFFMLLEQTVIIRAFLLRNKKTLFLFEAFGMSSKEKRRLLFCLIQGFIWFGVITGYLLAALIGFTYINSAFREYGKFYVFSLHFNVLREAVIVGTVLIGVFIFVEYIKNEPVISGLSGMVSGRQKRYRFKKLNISVAIIQTVCIFFTLASFNFMNTFSGEDGVMEYDMCSKRETVCYPLKEYSVALYGNDRFSFEALDAFAEYEDNISLSAEAETNQSTILLESDNTDSYFSQYCVYDGDMLRPKDGDEALWNQVSNEANQYTAVPAGNVRIVVLPQKDFNLFLEKHEISDSVPKDNTEKSCVLLLPDYNEVSSNPSVKEKEMIRLGGIWGDETNVEFCSESFRVEAIRSCDGEENSAIQIIMSEEIAKNSKTVVGYDSISVVVNKDTPVSIQKDIEQKVIHLMASVQGGLLDSSGQRNSRDELMRNYTVFMSNTILFFCIIVICIYIILSICIDREKYGFEYGVLRSFGMSYTTLQKKLFFQYGNGIIVACIFNIFLGKHAFTNGLLTWRQIIISIGITAGVTFLCGIWEFYRRKRQPIHLMLNKGNADDRT